MLLLLCRLLIKQKTLLSHGCTAIQRHNRTILLTKQAYTGNLDSTAVWNNMAEPEWGPQHQLCLWCGLHKDRQTACPQGI